MDINVEISWYIHAADCDADSFFIGFLNFACFPRIVHAFSLCNNYTFFTVTHEIYINHRGGLYNKIYNVISLVLTSVLALGLLLISWFDAKSQPLFQWYAELIFSHIRICFLVPSVGKTMLSNRMYINIFYLCASLAWLWTFIFQYTR